MKLAKMGQKKWLNDPRDTAGRRRLFGEYVTLPLLMGQSGDCWLQIRLQSAGVDKKGSTGWIGVICQFGRLYGGGPVGVDTLAAVLAEQRDMLEEVIEPYLMQTGF